MAITIKAALSTSLLAIIIVGGSARAMAGQAPAPASKPAITVKFADLNLSSIEGIRSLYSRISSAANQVCGAEPRWYPTEYWSQKECYRATLDSAVTRLNLPQLTALHRSITRGTPDAVPAQTVNR